MIPHKLEDCHNNSVWPNKNTVQLPVQLSTFNKLKIKPCQNEQLSLPPNNMCNTITLGFKIDKRLPPITQLYSSLFSSLHGSILRPGQNKLNTTRHSALNYVSNIIHYLHWIRHSMVPVTDSLGPLVKTPSCPVPSQWACLCTTTFPCLSVGDFSPLWSLLRELPVICNVVTVK